MLLCYLAFISIHLQRRAVDRLLIEIVLVLVGLRYPASLKFTLILENGAGDAKALHDLSLLGAYAD